MKFLPKKLRFSVDFNQDYEQICKIHQYLRKSENVEKLVKNYRNLAEKSLIYRKCAGAGAKCDLFKLEVRTRVRAVLNLDVRGACVRPKKRSQLTPWF